MKLLQKRLIEECYDGLGMWNGWATGSGHETSKHIR